VKNMAKIDSGLRETVRRELAWLADFICEHSELKNYDEVNRLLHQLLDTSV